MDMERLARSAAKDAEEKARKAAYAAEMVRRAKTAKRRARWLVGIGATVVAGWLIWMQEPAEPPVEQAQEDQEQKLERSGPDPNQRIWERQNANWTGDTERWARGSWRHDSDTMRKSDYAEGFGSARSPAGSIWGANATAQIKVTCHGGSNGTLKVEVLLRSGAGANETWGVTTKTLLSARWNEPDAPEETYDAWIQGNTIRLEPGEGKRRFVERLEKDQRMWLALPGKKHETLIWGTTLDESKRAIGLEQWECRRMSPKEVCDDEFGKLVAELNELDASLKWHNERMERMASAGAWTTAAMHAETTCEKATRYKTIAERAERDLGKRCWARKNKETGGVAEIQRLENLVMARLIVASCQ